MKKVLVAFTIPQAMALRTLGSERLFALECDEAQKPSPTDYRAMSVLEDAIEQATKERFTTRMTPRGNP